MRTTDEIIPLTKRLGIINKVLERYPDADEVKSHWDNNVFYHSKSVIKDPEVKLKFSGAWYNLSVEPRVILNCVDQEIIVYHSPGYINLTGDGCWVAEEGSLINLGYTKMMIKECYNVFLEKLTKKETRDPPLNIGSLPLCIKEKLVFL